MTRGIRPSNVLSAIALPTRIVAAMVAALALVGWSASSARSAPGLSRGVIATLAKAKATSLLQDARGRIVIAGAGFNPDARGFVSRFNADGSADQSFGQSGTVRWAYSRSLGWDLAALQPKGDIVLAGTDRFGAIDDHGTLHVDRLDPDGRVVTGFGQGGDVTLSKPSCLRGPTGIATDGSTIVLAALRWCSFHDPQSIVLVRLHEDGTVDSSFGTNGVVEVGATSIRNLPVTPLRLLRNGRLAVAMSPREGVLSLSEFAHTGARSAGFAHGGTSTVNVGPSGQIVDARDLIGGTAQILTVSGCSQDGPYLARFNSNGTPYRFWAPNGVATNVEPLGGVLGNGCGAFTGTRDGDFVGAGRAVIWFRPSGLLDLTRSIGRLPTGSLATALYAGRDGSVLVLSQRNTTSLLSRYH